MSETDTPRVDANTWWDHSTGEACDADVARQLERELAQAQARCAELEKDAERWQHSLAHGFPVLNQTAHTTAVRWIAHRLDGIEYGESANEATDAAIDAALKEPR